MCEEHLLAWYLLSCLFFLIWAFFVTTTTHSLARLGEIRASAVIKKRPKRFFYFPLHKLFFKQTRFELIIFATTLSENLARLGFAGIAGYGLLAHSPLDWTRLIAAFAGLLLLVLLVGDFFPRLFAIWFPEKALMVSLPYTSFFLYISFPLSLPFLYLANLASKEKEHGGDPLEEMKETIVQILQSANVKGRLNAPDQKLIESVIKFKDRIVREVMVPRVDLFSLPAEMPIKEAAIQLSKEGYSRTPVYRESVDNIVGVLMFKDVLELYMDCVEGKKDATQLNTPIETISKSVFYTPETKKVSHLLQEFRSKQMHMAIVVDEYGGTEGVVTMEDILEEIVGEIADEYDLDEELLYTTQPGGGSWTVDARMNILDAEDIFGIQIPQEGDYDTIGGYVFHKVGTIPQKGLRIHHEEFDLEILSTSERSVEKVRITLRPQESL